jgi:hypothetical protein
VTDCPHIYVSNAGRGGVPEYRPSGWISIPQQLMVVVCRFCGEAATVTVAGWAWLVSEGKAET